MDYDFSGWATKNDIRCTDGVIIKHGAFKDDDGKKVPLVWNHDDTSVSNVLGHAVLQHRDEGVYAYCSFNDTPDAQKAKKAVMHGDLNSLSIRAGKLSRQGSNILHGVIRELSLVLAGANRGAVIDNVLVHGELGDYEDETEVVINIGELIELKHVDNSGSDVSDSTKKDNRTVADVFNAMSDVQKDVVYFMIAQALENQDDVKHSDVEGDDNSMKKNTFDNDDTYVSNELLHAADFNEIIAIAKSGVGSLRAAANIFVTQHELNLDEIKHCVDEEIKHGITNLDVLFPDATMLSGEIEFIKEDDAWVASFLDAVKKTPFSRIKTVLADITEDEARARGYIKGKQKKEEVFKLLKRKTEPTTVYKLNKLDRNDVVDIKDINVVNFLRSEMRMMLVSEVARAMLIGDGRSESSPDKIDESCIRPIWTMEDLFSVKARINAKPTDTPTERASAFISAVIKNRKRWKGSGKPTMYASEDIITDCLLIKNNNGEYMYKNEEELAKTLRVKEIVSVPVMEGKTRETETETLLLGGIMVNPNDYSTGTDKGGEVTMFDDFDLDFNKYEYLIETRLSGSLTKPDSAIIFEFPTTTQSGSGGDESVG